MSLNVEVDALSDAELRAKLEEHNIPVGPIVASTRTLYRKKLVRILYGSNETDETLQDSIGGYEASMESSDHEEYLKPEAESSACTRHRLRSSKGSYSGDSCRELVVNKENKGDSKAITIQLYLIVILMVAVICLCVYLYLSWNNGSTYDVYNAIEAAAKAALKKTSQ